MKKKLLKRKSKQPAEDTGSLHNKTVAEHREQVLAGGRRFKYPHQYVRHKLVINAILISIVALIVLAGIGWWRLYQVQDTSKFMYRITSVLPLPVASVDGEAVQYSDYLLRYRSTEKWLREDGRIDLSGQDGQRQLNYYKRTVLTEVEKDAYARKLAKENGVNVSDDEVQKVIERTRQTANGVIPQEVYDISTKDTLGFDRNEYRHVIRQALLRQKVAYAIDSEATDANKTVARYLSDHQPKQLQTIVKKLQKKVPSIQYGASGEVPLNNQDGGLAELAATLKEGEISESFQSTAEYGYYFVRLVKKTGQSISYEYIAIPLTTFQQQFTALKEQGKIQEYIDVPEAEIKTLE